MPLLAILIKENNMAVRHTPPDSGESVVHKGQKGGTTGCGENTNDHPSHWSNTTAPVTCKRNGCKN